MTHVSIERFPSAAAFLSAAEPFLLRAETENAVILGVAQGLASGAAKATMTPYFGVVRFGDEIVMAAFMSLPGKLGVTRALKADAIGALARDIHAHGPHVETVGGPEPTSGELAHALAGHHGGSATRRMAQRIHEVRRVEYHGAAPGRMRLATADEHALLTGWATDFYMVVGDRSDPAAQVRSLTANEQLYVWDHNGPVSMAAWTGKTPNGVRVAYVYTPPALRGKGYATSCVAQLTKLLLDRGNKFCCLYTDLANPTSNAIYARIGYRGVCDAAMYALR